MSPKFLPDFDTLQASLNSERETAFESKQKELDLLESIDENLQGIRENLCLFNEFFERLTRVLCDCCDDGSCIHISVEEFHE